MSSRSSLKKRTASASSLRKLPPIRLSDLYLERILSEDDEYLNVICIRNELIEHALDQCHESYIKTQSVKFLMDCLHKAYLNVFNTVHMYYDTAVIDNKLSLWQTGIQCQPLPLDNYSEFSVPFKTGDKDEISAISAIFGPVEAYHSPSTEFTPANLNVDDDEEEEFNKNMEDSLAIREAEYESTSMYEGAMRMSEEEMKTSPAASTTELFEEITSETSFFTAVAEAEHKFLPPIEQLRCEHPQVKSGELIPVDKAIKSAIGVSKKSYNVGLPPLRLKAKFKQAEFSRSTVKLGTSMSSIERLPHRPSQKNHLKKVESSVQFENPEEAETAETFEKKEKKVDIVG